MVSVLKDLWADILIATLTLGVLIQIGVCLFFILGLESYFA